MSEKRDIQQVVCDAMEIADPAQRARFIEAACGADEAALKEVRSLLNAATGLPALDVEQPAMEALAAAGVEAPGPDTIAGYRLLDILGEGGCGVVWLAEQTEPVRRRVALKVIKPGMDSRAVIARFEQERQALAVMDHANVARVFDGGVTDLGRPYFVMEYVKGEPITEYCDRKSLTVRERLELFILVCEAVQHAHHKGIIHRDIKPSNVLVTEIEGRAVPKVIDFGIAKAIDRVAFEQTMFSTEGQFIGTPEYMSPEQAGGQPDIDTRTDVYALGVMLYELLVGRLPFESGELRRRGRDEVLRIIREEDPPRPSTRLGEAGTEAERIAVARRDSRASILRELRRDLEWVPLKALRKERERRYDSPAALADDIRRYLDGRPLRAAPESRAYRARKFVRRNRGSVAATVAISLAIIGGVIATLVQAQEARVQRDEAFAQRKTAQDNAEEASIQRKVAEANAASETKARRRAESINEFVTNTFRSSDPYNTEGGQQTTILQAMTHAIKELDSGRFKDDPETEASLRATIATILWNNGRAAEAEPLFIRALAIRQQLFVGDHHDVAESLNDLAGVLRSLGREAEAESILVQALEMRQRLFNGDNPNVAQSLNNLAAVRASLGRVNEAEPLFLQTLEMRRRLFPGDNREVAESLNNLAFVLESLGRSGEAEPFLVQALEMRQRLFPGDYPEVAKSLSNLALVWTSQGRVNEAEPLFLRALEMHQRLFSGDNPEIATSLNNLAMARRLLGRAAETEPLFVQALEMRQRLFPGDHPEVADSLGNLALVRATLRRPEEAEPLFLQALEMNQRLFKGDHPKVAKSLNNLALVRLSLGRPADALPLAEQAVAMDERVLAPDHPDFKNHRVTLARCRKAVEK